MRYQDAPWIHEEITVAASARPVWELVSDIALPTRFSPELQRTEWLDGAARPEIGARFAGYNEHPMVGQWRSVSHVVDCVPERVFAWTVVDEDGQFGDAAPDLERPVARWRYELEPDGDATLLRHSACIGPGRSGLSKVLDRMPDQEAAVVAYRLAELRKAMRATLEGIAVVAEGRA